MMDAHLQKALVVAMSEVRKRRHEMLTLEHLLYGMASVQAGRRVFDYCGGSSAILRQQLDHFFAHYMDVLADEATPLEVVQTLAVQRVMQRAVVQVRSSGREVVGIGDVLVAIFEEEDSWAVYCLRKQGLTRLGVMETLSHGMDDGHDDDSVDDSASSASSSSSSDEHGSEGSKSKDPLKQYTIDLTKAALTGTLDPLVGRSEELSRIIEILARRRKNNPLLVGAPGTGKTAIIEGLALRIVAGDVPETFKGLRIFSLDLGSVLAGARYRGDFEGRMKAVINALGKIEGAILFVDEIHTLVGAGATSGGAMDASNLLKPLLADGKLRCIGSTTHEEFRNYFEKDRALVRRFQRIDIKEPSHDECVKILKGLQARYEAHHQVHYAPTALKAAVELSVRHVQERLLPDKAIDAMDEAGALVRLRTGFKAGALVTRQDIETVVARIANIPPRTVSGKERDRLWTLRDDLFSVVYGQNEAVDQITRAIVRSRAGLSRGSRPAGSFLFYGPTGVGKTELARQLASLLGIQFLRFDMSEYMEKHAVSRLIGAPPGYVGFDQGGLLTEAIRKTPYSLVLLDEIEKAHPDIFNVLLQVMDYATLTDNTGRKADCSNIILIMTSNAGARDMAASPMGFGEPKTGDVARRGLQAVENTFSPEFRNRLDGLIPFNALTPELMGQIVGKGLAALHASLLTKRVTLNLTDNARAWLAKEGYDVSMGARPLERLLREKIEDPLASALLFGELTKGGSVFVDTCDDGLAFTYTKKS